MVATRLLIWRHGRTEWNATRRLQGQLDVDLDDLGRTQALAGAARLADEKPDAIVASDLRRALSTAAELAELTGLPVRQDPRLRERDFGQWQGLTHAEIEQRFPAEYAHWRAGGPAGCGIEETEDLAKRAAAAMTEAADLAPGGTVVVVSHGGTAKHGAVALLGWPPSVLPGLGVLDNCRWLELRFSALRGWRLRAYNVG
jgi:broad specificity phosphatase PhoE